MYGAVHESINGLKRSIYDLSAAVTCARYLSQSFKSFFKNVFTPNPQGSLIIKILG